MRHPAAWGVWLGAVFAYAFAVSNPVYLGLAAASIAVAHQVHGRRPMRGFVIAGVVLIGFRILAAAIVSNPGPTVLLDLPDVPLLGDAVTAEALVEGVSEGMRFVLVFAAFGAANAAIDMSAVMRTIPASLRDAGLILSIAIAFIPNLTATIRDVRDAQLLRGQRRLKALAPSLVVPVLGMTLQRAFLLAESMDARGYGRAPASAAPRVPLLAGVALITGGAAIWVAGKPQIALAATLAGATCLVLSMRGAASTVTRIERGGVSRGDVVVMVVTIALVVAATIIARDTAFTAYPAITAPRVSPFAAALALGLGAPLVVPR